MHDQNLPGITGDNLNLGAARGEDASEHSGGFEFRGSDQTALDRNEVIALQLMKAQRAVASDHQPDAGAISEFGRRRKDQFPRIEIDREGAAKLGGEQLGLEANLGGIDDLLPVAAAATR